MRAVSAWVAIAWLVSACQFGALGSADPNIPRPYPDGCAAFGLSDRRCEFIVRKVERDLNVQPATIEKIELLGDPGCGQPGSCVRTVSFVVRVRVAASGSTQEESVFCMVGDQYSLICGDHPQIDVGTTSQGYRDIPGDATPVPTIDPAARAKAQPLRVDSFVVPIDHLGSYDVLVGTAVLPNGILTDASVGAVRLEPPDVVLDGPVMLAVVPGPGQPPFDNYYTRGWHEGVEAVSVRVRFSVSEPPASGSLTMTTIVVR